MTTYSPPAELPRNVGELTGTTPLTNSQRLATYLYKRAWCGDLRWFRAAPTRRRKS